MATCMQTASYLKRHFIKSGIPANIRIVECTEMGTTLKVVMDVSVEINAICSRPKEHQKSIKDKILENLANLEGDFQLAEAFTERPETSGKTIRNILEAKQRYDKLYEIVEKW